MTAVNEVIDFINLSRKAKMSLVFHMYVPMPLFSTIKNITPINWFSHKHATDANKLLLHQIQQDWENSFLSAVYQGHSQTSSQPFVYEWWDTSSLGPDEQIPARKGRIIPSTL